MAPNRGLGHRSRCARRLSTKPKDQQLFAPVLSAFQNWDGFPFVEELAVRVGAPVWVRSGVQTMTMGEFKSGNGMGVEDMIFVKLGRSISAGVISQGTLHRGAQGAAGMIGYTFVDGENLEAIAGSEAIEREARQAAESARSPYLRACSARAARSPSPMSAMARSSATLLHRASGALWPRSRQALAPLANLLNPSLIVLGGRVAQTGDILLAAVREAVYRQSHPLVTRDLRIMRSQMGGSAGLVGAAQVVVPRSLFDPGSCKVGLPWVRRGASRLQGFPDAMPPMR